MSFNCTSKFIKELLIITTCESRFPINTMEDTSLAAPTPEPMAIPMCDEAKAAASLIPSPTIATIF